MAEQLELDPAGLSPDQLKMLTGFANRAEKLSVMDLAGLAAGHVSTANQAYQRNRMINVRLCRALGEAIDAALVSWNKLDSLGKYWLAGAILYFSKNCDDEADFNSPIGFEDDAEVLNACFRLARLESLCINPADYDDA